MSSESRRPPLPLPAALPLAAPADFDEELARLGVSLKREAIQQLGQFLALLLAMNEQMNLTAVTKPDEAWSRHLLDALSLVPHLANVPPNARLLDVGSGGGVPGLPLAIARPDLQVTLLDATEKKVAFLNAAAAKLGLTNVEAVCGRAESIDLGESFEVVTARAVAKISALVPWTAPFAKKGGRLLFIKGARADIELGEAKAVLRRFRCTHEETRITPTGRIVRLRVDD
jgi:16S rRNA (guanine527-N7)-methyltransferase